jgi:hypothetical protein
MRVLAVRLNRKKQMSQIVLIIRYLSNLQLRLILAVCLFMSITWSLYGQEMDKVDDFFRSTGKINVVIGVILILFIGIIIYLISLDRKIKSLENRIKNEQ